MAIIYKVLFPLCMFIGTIRAINIIGDYYMQYGQFGTCSEMITDETSAYLRSHVGAYQLGSMIGYRPNEDCSVGFDAGEGKQVLVKFLKFRLQEPSNDVCVDYLTIEELGNNDTDNNNTYCGSQAINPYVSDAENITLIFHTDGPGTEDSGFKILLTSFRTSVGACSSGEFKCDSTRCIDESLKCDGVEHCVDGTDESSTEAGCTWLDSVVGAILSLGQHTILAIGIVIGSALFITIATVVVYHVFIKKKNRVKPSPTPASNRGHSSSSESKTNKVATVSRSSERHKKATSSSSTKKTTTTTPKRHKKREEFVDDDIDW